MKKLKTVGVVIVVAAFATLLTAYLRAEYELKQARIENRNWNDLAGFMKDQHVATITRDKATITALKQSAALATNASAGK